MAGELLTADQALIARLQTRIADLERELADKDQNVAVANQSRNIAIANLRRQLAPLYTALQQVFGELETFAPESIAEGTGVGPTGGYWDTWKTRLSPSARKVLDALLQTPHLGSSQLAATLRMDPRTVRDALQAMRKVGILATSAEGKHSLQIPGGGA